MLSMDEIAKVDLEQLGNPCEPALTTMDDIIASTDAKVWMSFEKR